MNTPSQAQVRRAIAEAQTIVVKVGSSSLTEPSGHLDPERLNALVAALARVRLMGGRVVLVSSGAIAAGFGSLGFDARPTDVADQQACAAVGQGLLMAQYEAAFARYGLRVGQILITVSDTIAPQQYRNVRRTLERLLDLGAVPIINENDSLASNEIRFGDNDRLSALIANIVVADALVLLTDVDALYTAPPSEPESKRIAYVPNVEAALEKVQVGGTGSNVGTGGMVTKMEAARVAAVSGIPSVLTCAANAGPAMMGDPVGTAFAPIHDRGSSLRHIHSARWWPTRAPPRPYVEERPVCSPRACWRSEASSPRETLYGSTTRPAIIWPRAWPASIPRKSHRCLDAIPLSSSGSWERNTRIRSYTVTISYLSEADRTPGMPARSLHDACREGSVFRVAGLA